MTLQQFQAHLREAIYAARIEFSAGHPDETIYAMAIMLGQGGNYLGLAFATEQGLQRTAAHYYQIGYRYECSSWEEMPESYHVSKLTASMRWSHPDDGWYYEDFPERYEVASILEKLVSDNTFASMPNAWKCSLCKL